ncbi:MAG TPA: signal peptidase II [Tepidisphaeraceae bacterium]|nr:signal peptidase II [Tepidisphaeraceae bacterium]
MENFRSPLAVILFVGTTLVGLGADMATKVAAFRDLHPMIMSEPGGRVVVYYSDTYQLVPGWLEFTCTANQGAVFGIGQGQRTLFIVVSILAIGFLSALFARSGKQRGYQFILGMLLAGVLGNMIDRVTLGYVRDMIHGLPRWPALFPWIFNVADSMLVVGVTLMIIRGFVVGENKNAVVATPAES